MTASDNAIAPKTKTVLIAGASGLVGRALIDQLLADDSVGTIVTVARKALEIEHPKLRYVKLNLPFTPLTLLADVPRTNEMYITLGTTIKAAGSRDAFREVDLDLVVYLAKVMRLHGVKHLAVVTALGSNPNSSNFYLRTKGEAESGLQELGFERLVIVRPSFLAGNRGALGQPIRLGERLALGITKLFKPIIPKHYRSVDVKNVAAAMVRELRNEANPSIRVVESEKI